MKTRLSILAIIFTLAFFNCKNESSVSLNYSYSDKPAVINCKGSDSLFVKEVLYTFENDILKAYDPTSNNLRRAYTTFLRNATNGRADYSKLVSDHTIEVYNALKTSDLWKNGSLNYDNKLFACIGENVSDKALNTTYNSLLSSGYMSNKLFGAPLAAKSGSLINDKYLSTFVALDFYFAHLEGITPQPEVPQMEKTDNGPVDFNKVPPPSAQ